MRLFVLLITLFIHTHTKSQNLLANPSFEDMNTCTEYNAACAPEAWFFYLGNLRQSMSHLFERSFSGKHAEVIYAGTIGRKPAVKDVLYTKLLCPLKAGADYIFTFWLLKEDNEIPDIQIALPNTEPGLYQKDIRKETTSFILNRQHIVNSAEGGWVQLGIEYRAKGDEQYLMLGCWNGKVLDMANYIATDRSGDVYFNIDDIAWVPVDSNLICSEAAAIQQQLYNQNKRHTPKVFVSNTPIDSSLIKPIVPATVIKPVTPLQRTDTLVIPDILFQFNSYQLNLQFSDKLDSLVDKIRYKKFVKIQINGHTDNVGTDLYNQRLSLQRAQAVKNYIQRSLSLPDGMVEVVGWAATKPITQNKTEAQRQQNRRVEIVLFY
jgi:outer membrane protein OmpA-like peptidoglycan-associated protein